MPNKEITRRGFLGVTAAAGSAALAGCNTDSGNSEEQESLEETANENLEPTENSEPKDSLENSMEEFSTQLSETYDTPEGEDLVTLSDKDGDGDQTLTVNVDVDQVYDEAGIDIDNVNAFDVYRAGDLKEFAGDISTKFLEDIFNPLMSQIEEYRASNVEEGESHSFVNIRMHATDETSFSLTVDSELAYNVNQDIDQNPEKETSMMHMLLNNELGVSRPTGDYESSFYVAEGESQTITIEGRERTIEVDSVHTDQEGKEWTDIDVDGEDTNYSTDEDAATFIDGWFIERDINPSPYSEGVALEIVDDSYAAHLDCDPISETIETGEKVSYMHEGNEIGAEVVEVTDRDSAVLRVSDGIDEKDPYLLKVEEGERYSVGLDMNYEAESIINLPDEKGFVELNFNEDDCYR